MNDSSRLHIPVTLSLGKEPIVPTNKKLGGPQSWSEHFGEEEDLLPLLVIKPRTVWPEA